MLFNKKIALVIICQLLVMFFVGCTPPVEKKLLSCLGAASLEEAIERLQANSKNIISFRVNGKCQSRFYDGGKKYQENFGVKVWAEPTKKLRLQGDIFLDPKGIVLGANEQEFWFSIKPEMSTYVWGKWSDQGSVSAGLINPATLLEAFGSPKIEDKQQWALTNDQTFDILTRTNDRGKTVKKIYVYCCDSLVKKIEYYGKDGKAALIAKLDEYQKLGDSFFVPGVIELVTFDEKGNENSFKMTFETYKPYEFSDKQKEALFIRPEPRGFKNVYQIVKNKAVEQTKQ
jgi:hypothetical protein